WLFRAASPQMEISPRFQILSTMAASSRTESRASLPDSRLLSSPSSAWSSPVPLPQKPKTQKRIFLARLTRFLFVSSCSTSWPLQSRSEEHTSELQSRFDLVCRLLLETKKKRQS